MTKNTGSERLLRAISKFDDDQIPANARGQIDYKNLTLRLREITADDGEWQVRQEDRQNFYRSDELKTAIDILVSHHRLAERQDVNIDELAKSRIAATNKRAKEDRDGAVEARAQYAAVLAALNEARAENVALRREVEGLKAQMDMVRSGLVPKVN